VDMCGRDELIGVHHPTCCTRNGCPEAQDYKTRTDRDPLMRTRAGDGDGHGHGMTDNTALEIVGPEDALLLLDTLHNAMGPSIAQ